MDDVATFCVLFQEYIHRVGRTARGENASGHALLILRPEEIGFLCYLKRAKIPLNEYDVDWKKVKDIQMVVSCVIE
jgi:ATP-dependent RNA helicase DDX18/HAS1